MSMLDFFKASSALHCRTGRAGRGTVPGSSVLLCSKGEVNKLRDLELSGGFRFERRALPAVAECQELVLKQITCESLPNHAASPPVPNILNRRQVDVFLTNGDRVTISPKCSLDSSVV